MRAHVPIASAMGTCGFGRRPVLFAAGEIAANHQAVTKVECAPVLKVRIPALPHARINVSLQPRKIGADVSDSREGRDAGANQRIEVGTRPLPIGAEEAIATDRRNWNGHNLDRLKEIRISLD